MNAPTNQSACRDVFTRAHSLLRPVDPDAAELRIMVFGTRVMRFESGREEDIAVLRWLQGRNDAPDWSDAPVCRRVMSENGAGYEPRKRASAHAVVTLTDESQAQALKLLDDLSRIAGELRECPGLGHIRAFEPHRGNEPVEWWTVLLELADSFGSAMRDRVDLPFDGQEIGAELGWGDVSVPWDGDSVRTVRFPSLVRSSAEALRVLAGRAAATCK